MPAVTVNSIQPMWANGNMVQLVANISIATTGDTWDTTLANVYWFGATPAASSASQIGGTVSNGTITFATGGAEANVLVTVIGDGE